MDAREQGRADLVAWVAAQPDDLYADDHALQALTSAHSLAPYAERFHAAGSTVAGPLDRVVRENNLARNLPVLDDWSGVGEYTARVSHHPTWAEAGRLIYGTGTHGPVRRAACIPSRHPHAVLPDGTGGRGGS